MENTRKDLSNSSYLFQNKRILILGAGPAGLSAAWELARNSFDMSHVVILESDAQVGGISKTVQRNGWRFDLGGHRFFSKSKEVNQMWDEMLSPELMLMRPRKSRIYYRGKYFDYPLKPLNALWNLGPLETFRCILSYALVRLRPPKDQTNFEGWVAARFGWRLYRIFFKTYTEKVWGISTTQLQATWAAQRIKNLSLFGAIKNAFGLSKKKSFTSLIEEFKYPKQGPGQLWETTSDKLQSLGTRIYLNTKVVSGKRVEDCYLVETESGESFEADAVFSSLPLSVVPEYLEAPREIVEFGKSLKYRDFLVVCIPVQGNESLFDDNWIYIHDSKVKVGRIQNYGSWSPFLVKPGTSCLGLEYFASRGDNIWSLTDETLKKLALEELSSLGLEVSPLSENGFVVRVERAYPVYDFGYEIRVEQIRGWLQSSHPDWFQMGRNGQHRYNNQDHSMLTATTAVHNFLTGRNDRSYWDINIGDDYHEEKLDTREAPLLPSTD